MVTTEVDMTFLPDEIEESGEALSETTDSVELLVMGLNRQGPICGASVWGMSSGTGATYLGATDNTGRIEISPMHQGMRIMARGYAHVDVKPRQRHVLVTPRWLHPGAYSGYLTGHDDALWVADGATGPCYHFTAFGLMRDAKDMETLEASKFRQYSMMAGVFWMPGADPTPQRREWTSLATRSYSFPANGRWVQTIDGLNEFRFPEPALMIARNSSTKREVRFRVWN